MEVKKKSMRYLEIFACPFFVVAGSDLWSTLVFKSVVFSKASDSILLDKISLRWIFCQVSLLPLRLENRNFVLFRAVDDSS